MSELISALSDADLDFVNGGGGAIHHITIGDTTFSGNNTGNQGVLVVGDQVIEGDTGNITVNPAPTSGGGTPPKKTPGKPPNTPGKGPKKC